MIGCGRGTDASPDRMCGERLPVTARTSWIALAGVLLLAWWLRVVQIDESLWLDELHTAWTVAGDWSDVAWRAAIGNQSPAYFFLVKAATTLAGLNEAVVRAPSAAAGMGLVLVAAGLAARWTGWMTGGVLAALWLALDRNCVFYSQEARPYAWVQLVGLIHVGLFIYLLDRPSGVVRGLWIVLGLGLYYLHYTAALLLPAEIAAWVLLQARPAWRPAYGCRQVAVDLGLIALGLLPSLPQVGAIAQRREAWSLFIPRAVPVWAIFRQFPLEIYLLLPAAFSAMVCAWRSLWSRASRCNPAASSGLASPPAAVGEDGGSALETCCGPETARPQQASLRCLVVLACWLFVPLTLAWIATVTDLARLFFPRYLIVSAAAAPILAACIVASCRGAWWRAVAALAMTTALVWHAGLIPQYRWDGRVIGDRRQDWRGAVQRLQQEARTSDAPIFVRSGLIEAEDLETGSERLIEYCLLPVRGIYQLDVPATRLVPLPTTRSGELTRRQVDRVAAAGEAWFLLAGNPTTADRIAETLRRTLARAGHRGFVTQREAFGNVAVLHVAISPLRSDSRKSKPHASTLRARRPVPVS